MNKSTEIFYAKIRDECALHLELCDGDEELARKRTVLLNPSPFEIRDALDDILNHLYKDMDIEKAFIKGGCWLHDRGHWWTFDELHGAAHRYRKALEAKNANFKR